MAVGVLAAAEISQTADLPSAATNYRNVGASVTVLDARGQIDGNTCEALAAVPGINKAGAVRVAGTFASPDDGRVSGFGYTALVPASANGIFDQCWIEVWPESAEISNMVNLALSRNQDALLPTTCYFWSSAASLVF